RIFRSLPAEATNCRSPTVTSLTVSTGLEWPSSTLENEVATFHRRTVRSELADARYTWSPTISEQMESTGPRGPSNPPPPPPVPGDHTRMVASSPAETSSCRPPNSVVHTDQIQPVWPRRTPRHSP